MSFYGRLELYQPIFMLLSKDAPTKWTKECSKAFDTIKSHLLNPLVLVPPRAFSFILVFIHLWKCIRVSVVENPQRR